MPVMEGKAILFKHFAGVDAVPLTLGTTDVDEIVATIVNLAPSFGGINLEDISAPRCFEIERQLIEKLDIPVFHDDQHGTAIVTLAALRNAVRVTDRDLSTTRVVISGAGAAGMAIESLLRAAGISKICVADSQGVISSEREHLTPSKQQLAASTANWARSGTLADALVGADVFIGVSGGTVPESALARMADDAIIFALANPTPEVHPRVARKHARIVATGRSDFPNQVNNVLVFPGVFRGALDVRATSISQSMKLAAASALSDLIADELRDDFIIPSPFDPRVSAVVANAVIETALLEGRTRRAG
jgi:malate dehydrogenase (oxaloacetate-decarboxylating)